MDNCEVLVATVAHWVLVGTKPDSKLGSTAACSGSGDAPAGTMCQPTITMLGHARTFCGTSLCSTCAAKKESLGP